MHEQTNKCFLGLLVDILEQLGQRQEVIVVDPDEIAWLPDTRKLFSKQFIGLEVSFPVRLFRRNLSRDVLPEEVVEKWPKGWKGKEGRIFPDVTRQVRTYWSCSNPRSVRGRPCHPGIQGRRTTSSSVRHRRLRRQSRRSR